MKLKMNVQIFVIVKEDDADAKNDENGVRTRRVTAAALHALLKKAMPGQKDYTFLDEAKLLSLIHISH